MDLNLILLSIIVSAITTYVLTPWIIYKAQKLKLIGFDVNKSDKRPVANFGGFAIVGALVTAILVAILIFTFYSKDSNVIIYLLASISSILIVSIIGVLDDLFKLHHKAKVILPVAGALPLMAIKAGETIVGIPFIGPVDLGILYTFVVIPLGITGAANATNMAAGYNGLEAGIGAIVAATLLLIAISTNALAPALILAALLGACLMFLKFNWTPAKVFPADIGTYAIGTTIAAAAIMGNMEKYAVIAILPAFYELLATIYYEARGVKRREICHAPLISNDGKITPPKGSEKFTLAFLTLAVFGSDKERNLVLKLLSFFALTSAISLLMFYFKV